MPSCLAHARDQVDVDLIFYSQVCFDWSVLFKKHTDMVVGIESDDIDGFILRDEGLLPSGEQHFRIRFSSRPVHIDVPFSLRGRPDKLHSVKPLATGQILK